MEEIEKLAKNQLMLIEQIYGIKFTNRDETARLIAKKIDNSRQVLTICTSLNSWVLLNKKQGEVVIPHEVIDKLLNMAEWHKKNA